MNAVRYSLTAVLATPSTSFAATHARRLIVEDLVCALIVEDQRTRILQCAQNAEKRTTSFGLPVGLHAGRLACAWSAAKKATIRQVSTVRGALSAIESGNGKVGLALGVVGGAVDPERSAASIAWSARWH